MNNTIPAVRSSENLGRMPTADYLRNCLGIRRPLVPLDCLLEPGDAIICNDPDIGSGHLPDVFQVAPSDDVDAAPCTPGRDAMPFLFTTLFFVASYLTLGVMFWPYMVPYAVTVANAAAPDASLGFFLGVIAHEIDEVVDDTGRTAGARGDLLRAVVVDWHVEQPAGAVDDGEQGFARPRSVDQHLGVNIIIPVLRGGPEDPDAFLSVDRDGRADHVLLGRGDGGGRAPGALRLGIGHEKHLVSTGWAG